jgi:protein O-mannosyl-transferase
VWSVVICDSPCSLWYNRPVGKKRLHQDKSEVTESKRAGLFVPILLLVVICAACYVNSLPCGFAIDDAWTVIDHPLNSSPHPVIDAFKIKTLVRDYSDAPGVYRPIPVLALWANWKLSHSAWTFHLVNALLHLICVILLYLLVLRLWRRRDLAFVTALLFGVWPTHVESVTWISARNDMVSAAFVLGSLLALVNNRPAVYVAILAGAIFSKESALIIPAVGVAHALISGRRSLWPHLAAFAVLGLMLLGRHYAHWTERAALFVASMPLTPHATALWTVLATMVYLGRYLRMSALPMPYTPIVPTVTTGNVIESVALLLTLLVIWAAFRKRTPGVTAGAAWFVASALATTPMVYSQLQLAERYSYLPQMGVALALAGILLSFGRAGRVVIATMVLAACLFTVTNNRIWTSDTTYWTYSVKMNPDDAAAFNNLGTSLLQEGKTQEAIAPIEKAVQLEPTNAFGHANLGMPYINVGRLSDGSKQLETARRLAPTNPAITEMLKNVRPRQ